MVEQPFRVHWWHTFAAIRKPSALMCAIAPCSDWNRTTQEQHYYTKQHKWPEPDRQNSIGEVPKETRAVASDSFIILGDPRLEGAVDWAIVMVQTIADTKDLQCHFCCASGRVHCLCCFLLGELHRLRVGSQSMEHRFRVGESGSTP